MSFPALRLSCSFYVSFFSSSRRRHTRSPRDWSSDVCSSDLEQVPLPVTNLWSNDVTRVVTYQLRGVTGRSRRVALRATTQRLLRYAAGGGEVADTARMRYGFRHDDTSPTRCPDPDWPQPAVQHCAGVPSREDAERRSAPSRWDVVQDGPDHLGASGPNGALAGGPNRAGRAEDREGQDPPHSGDLALPDGGAWHRGHRSPGNQRGAGLPGI